ncbi:MAG: DUF393 domain-containing protein [Curvibacter sp.]
MQAGIPPELTVYYDGSCPLCRREIALYRRQRGAERLVWQDLRAGAPTGPGLSCDTALRRFHVRDAQGRLHSGAAGFARLWRSLPAWRVPGWLASLPPMCWLLELAYRGFLRLRPRLQRWARARWAEPAA